MKFLNLFKRNRKPRVKKYILDNERKTAMVKAFSLDGVDYFCMAEATQLAAGRGLSAMVIYDEFRMKCDYEYLQDHVKAVNILLNSSKIRLTEIFALHQNLEQRLSVAVMPEHLYKLASVYYFTAEESPYYYDQKYNEGKIEKWKQNPEALSFFLTGPLASFLPFLELPKEDLQTYLRAGAIVDKLTREHLHTGLSKNP